MRTMRNNSLKRVVKSTVRIAAVLLLLTTGTLAAGCGKKAPAIQVFTYQENDDQTITINGLTDKGKTDAKITVPAQIDGKPVISIENETFRDDQNIKEIVIEEGVKKIGSNTFLSCRQLEKISFPGSVEEIGSNAVKSSLWGDNILNDQDEVVINNILVQVRDGIENYTVPDNVKYISSGLFYQNTDLKNIEFSEGLEEIGTFAFSGCTGLSEVKMPESLKKIGYSAFSECTGLKDVKLNDQITEISTDAFLNVSHISYTGTISGSPWGALSAN